MTIDDQDGAAVMRACNVDLEKLKRSLTSYIESELDNLVTDGGSDPAGARVHVDREHRRARGERVEQRDLLGAGGDRDAPACGRGDGG